jgi:putative redox protein
MKTKTIKCVFKNSSGFNLDARLDLSIDFNTNENIRAFIVFCHCFTCSKETITTYRLSRLLAEQGYGVLRFDFSGLGNSEGDFSDTTFSGMQDDLNSAINFLKKNYRTPQFLMGHSLGGTTAISVAKNHDEIKAVVTIASPSEPQHVLHHFGDAVPLLEKNEMASFFVASRRFNIKPDFLQDVRAFDMQENLSKLNKPVLIINIEDDALVEASNAQDFQQWVKAETQLVTLKNTDHLLTNREATAEAAEIILDWIKTLE